MKLSQDYLEESQALILKDLRLSFQISEKDLCFTFAFIEDILLESRRTDQTS